MGELFYKVVWEQLPKITNSKILDFGSGLGFTANHLSKNNNVIAIEPNCDMVKMSVTENSYHQVIGNLENLKQLEANSFDMILCHNVFEYAKEREDIFKEFYRVSKPNGVISLVKHNHAGRIMAKAVFDNNLDEALSLLNGGAAEVPNFGEVNYYDISTITKWIGSKNVNIEKILGVRTFWGLQQNNEPKYDPIWQEKILELEMKVCDIDEFKNIAFFNHVLLRKLS